MSAIQYFPYTGILQSQAYSLHNTIHDHLIEYGEIQRRLCEMNHTVPSEIWPLFPSSAPWTHFPKDYIKKINIDRQIYEKRFTNPIDPQLKFNISSLNSVLWNPFWPPPIIDPEPEQPLYWQDSQDPYELDNDFDPEDFYCNRLRQNLDEQTSQMPQPVPMD